MKPDAFSATIDTRFYPGPIWDMFSEIVEAVTVKGAAINSLLLRSVFEMNPDVTSSQAFMNATKTLSTQPLIADVYYIVSGTNPGEGVACFVI